VAACRKTVRLPRRYARTRRREPDPRPKIVPGEATRIEAAATLVTMMAWLAASPWSRAARRKRAAPGKRLRSARMAMFAILLPKRSPTARSTAPRRTAVPAVINSGNEVAKARKTRPTHKPPRRVRAAMTSPLRASITPATTTPAAAAVRPRRTKARLFA
jgi:hypothetical protein